jgi:hypothetical protein
MTLVDDDLLTEVEKKLKAKFERSDVRGLPSNSTAVAPSPRVNSLLLNDEERSKMPITADKFVVRENPLKVAWEREVRKFGRQLNMETGHRISASMIYEWATGVSVKEYIELEGKSPIDLRVINIFLRHYFGASYTTYIAGHKVPNCYRVKPGHRMKRRVPLMMTLRAEFYAGTLAV